MVCSLGPPSQPQLTYHIPTYTFTALLATADCSRAGLHGGVCAEEEPTGAVEHSGHRALETKCGSYTVIPRNAAGPTRAEHSLLPAKRRRATELVRAGSRIEYGGALADDQASANIEVVTRKRCERQVIKAVRRSGAVILGWASQAPRPWTLTPRASDELVVLSRYRASDVFRRLKNRKRSGLAAVLPSSYRRND